MPLRRMLCALGAAIVLIVLSLAPTVAQAHILHRHHVVVHAHGDHGQSAFDSSESATSSAVMQQAQSDRTGEPASDSDRNCVGACCASVCAACCAAGLPASAPFVPLSGTTTPVAFADYQLGPDRAPEALRRPPRPFI